MKIRVGASGKGEKTYSALNVMASTDVSIFGNMGEKQESEEMARIQDGIPDPPFGYIRGSSVGYQTMGNSLRTGLIERDLGNLVYVDKLGRGESEMPFMCDKRDCACR